MLVTTTTVTNTVVDPNDATPGDRCLITLCDGTVLTAVADGFDLGEDVDPEDNPNHIRLDDNYPDWVVAAIAKHLEELRSYIMQLTSDDPSLDHEEILDQFARPDLMLAWLEGGIAFGDSYPNARVTVCIGTSEDLIMSDAVYPPTRIQLDSPIKEIQQIESRSQEVPPAR